MGAPFFAMRHKSVMDFVFDRDAVRAALKASRLTQEQFAALVGLTHKSAVPKILDGTRRVKVEEAAKIYEVLRMIPVAHDGVKTIPLIGLASAGRWREAVQVPAGTMLLPRHVGGPRVFGVEVRGDSMDKLIPDGGWIAVDPDDKALVAGKTYLIQNEEYEVTVKRYERNPARFEPLSHNEDHAAFLASDVDFRVLGRVVWKGEPI
jgi:SOS-response transcriptional repressor LexA